MSQYNWLSFIKKKLKSKAISNSFWAVGSNLLQNIFFSLFFVIVARKYNATDFSSYILANTLYGLVLAFSSLGLGQWFVRRLLKEVDKEIIIHQFFKLQFIIGCLFYTVNLILAFVIYKDHLLRQLSVLIGVNVIFDNIIYVIKHINIAQMDQKKTFVIQTIESFIKLIVGIAILFFPFSIIHLSLVIIALRFLTLNAFLNIGTSFPINFRYLLKVKVDLSTFKEVVLNNWPFIVIGSISVLYWKMGNIFISTFLTLKDVAHYEISYKLFSIAEVIPVIVSTSIFPVLLKKMNDNKNEGMRFYKQLYISYGIYGLFVFTFIYSFSDQLIPWMFGGQYALTARYCKEMFLTMLVFPTAILQANMLVALNYEKTDMWLNLLSLILNILFTLVGLFYLKEVTVINLSILFSFLCFHLFQDYILIRKKMTTTREAIRFYMAISIALIFYYMLSLYISLLYTFVLFWALLFLFAWLYFEDNIKKQFKVAVQ
jgi:O-antigen/teichoic acid export membrane protein